MPHLTSTSIPGRFPIICIVRHAERLDQYDRNWSKTAERPYDTPLTKGGIAQAAATGRFIRSWLHDKKETARRRTVLVEDEEDEDDDRNVWVPNVVIHTSPFLRCMETATALANQLYRAPSRSGMVNRINRDASEVEAATYSRIRIDDYLGEWLNPVYFSELKEPPPSTLLPVELSPNIDATWDRAFFSEAGTYPEEWESLELRLRAGLRELLLYYSSQPDMPDAVVLITHAAPHAALLHSLSGYPVLQTPAISSLTMAVPTPTTKVDLKGLGAWDFKLQASTAHLKAANFAGTGGGFHRTQSLHAVPSVKPDGPGLWRPGGSGSTTPRTSISASVGRSFLSHHSGRRAGSLWASTSSLSSMDGTNQPSLPRPKSPPRTRSPQRPRSPQTARKPALASIKQEKEPRTPTSTTPAPIITDGIKGVHIQDILISPTTIEPPPLFFASRVPTPNEDQPKKPPIRKNSMPPELSKIVDGEGAGKVKEMWQQWVVEQQLAVGEVPREQGIRGRRWTMASPCEKK
ncbi:phosphoglycerate mutase-like protein [Saitoella complicata NRRL Y-17804]|uniref:Uncharacterized protein n=1 Tax=Saitoella complicata (strain BCRC 22490 / CBS 7301 / JCM 7358 / NBRC 10748 / NRRL Y-17804) TaxID=698492 RepID=A0A0E9NFN1_SAICN|nr:phosphoglycerate mutase-like protein [Saitoella complicata NRRL Y-17804]ODQ51987.1 phosphoglycerate mutase-like protein [Saitoella complicata NRRL Y-17804]GAO48623.1 hypothetical protein G7K_2793-t1 [Saitoella complicata NRRL Y-17804]